MTSISKQRILIALDAIHPNEESLVMLVNLAVQLKASLSGLFVEDSRLLEVASLPFSTEIHRISAQERNLQVDNLTRLNKRASLQIQRRLNELSSQYKIDWTFNVEPGELFAKALSQKGFDVFLPARKRSELRPKRSQAQDEKQLNLILIYDLSPQFQRAIEIARLLAAGGMVSDITILCNRGLPLIITEQLPKKGIKLHILSAATSYPEILKSLPLSPSTLLLLPKKSICQLSPNELSTVFTRMASSLLLLD